MPTSVTVAAWAATVLCALTFLHPYVFYPLSLRLLRDRPLGRSTPGSGTDPTFTVMFCAYNESAVIEAKIANLRDLAEAWPGLEVLAYDDASSDGTFEALAARPELVRVVRGTGRTGKAHGMKLLAAEATGDLLVCTDANVMLDPAALRAFADAYADPAVGGVCGRLVYSASEGSATEDVGGAYWRLEETIKDRESRTGNVMGADGSIFSVRRSVYPDFPDTVQDDFTVSMNVLFAGRRLVRRTDAVAHEALVASSREEFRRKVRIAARAYHTHLHLRPGLKRLGRVDRYKYASHKLLRWHSASVLVLGVLAFAVALAGQCGLVVLAATVAVVVVLAALAGAVRPRAAGQVREILLAILATNWGVWQALGGRTYATWQPPPR